MPAGAPKASLIINQASYTNCECLTYASEEHRVIELEPKACFTPLHYAICHGEEPSVARLLMANGASPITHLKSKMMPYNISVLHEAVQISNPKLVQDIIQHPESPSDSSFSNIQPPRLEPQIEQRRHPRPVFLQLLDASSLSRMLAKGNCLELFSL
ncbi:Ankyrin repeat [Fusarium oxysporum f. sp. vasinfectum]|nr:hypothetical protein FocnCong_v021295 [Fusarium oxysporum f. sp. conglutinans]KAK2669108.1 Ankyrin repeat [Fusarium oxysporum f. sp. vasinfectum]